MKDYVCKQCKKEFKAYPSNGKCLFCSKKCFYEWESKNLIGEKRYNWKPKKYCIDCGKLLSRRKYTRCIECSSKICGKESHHYIHGLKNTREYARIYERLARNKRLGAEGSHTQQEWLELKEFFNYMCLCCKKHEPEIKLTEDHIVPLARGGTDFIDNIQPLCKNCNSRKYAKTVDYRKDWLIL